MQQDPTHSKSRGRYRTKRFQHAQQLAMERGQAANRKVFFVHRIEKNNNNGADK
jgi:hypothetical protein